MMLSKCCVLKVCQYSILIHQDNEQSKIAGTALDIDEAVQRVYFAWRICCEIPG